MKKLLAILLSVLMLCTMIPFATVFAYDVPTIVAETVSEADAGDEIEVAVSLMGNPGVIGALVEVEYDHDVFELVPYVEYDEDLDEEVEYNVEHATGWGDSYVFFGPPGKCNMGFSNGTARKNVTKELYFTAYFKVKDDAVSGTYTLKVVHNNKNFFNMEGDQVDFAAEDAIITINGSDPEPPACEHEYDNDCDVDCNICGAVREVNGHIYSNDFDATCNVCGAVREVSYIFGDANGDGKVNVRDLGLLERYLNKWDVEIALGACDVTGDGKINVRDLAHLERYLNGWDVTLGS